MILNHLAPQQKRIAKRPHIASLWRADRRGGSSIIRVTKIVTPRRCSTRFRRDFRCRRYSPAGGVLATAAVSQIKKKGKGKEDPERRNKGACHTTRVYGPPGSFSMREYWGFGEARAILLQYRYWCLNSELLWNRYSDASSKYRQDGGGLI